MIKKEYQNRKDLNVCGLIKLEIQDWREMTYEI